MTGRLILAYLGVSPLHGLWDWMHSLAIRLTLILTEGERYVPTPNGWIVQPTPEQARLVPILEWSGLGLLSVIGIGWLVAEWRWARRVSRTRRPLWPARPVAWPTRSADRAERRDDRGVTTLRQGRYSEISTWRGFEVSALGTVMVRTPSCSCADTASEFTSPGSIVRNSNRP